MTSKIHPISGGQTASKPMTSIDADIVDELALPQNFEELAREHGVPEAAMAEVKSRSLSIIAHKRRDGANAFSFGNDIGAVAPHFDKERFKEFAAEAHPYSVKHVTDFMRVAAELGPWRSRSIRASFTSTHLIRMLARTPEDRDSILAKAEAGEKVTAADISSWGKPEEEAVDPLSCGELAGLRVIAQAKARAGSAAFGANVGSVIVGIEDALATGRSIAKKGLVDTIQSTARQAGGELLNLASFVQPDIYGDVTPARLPAKSDWGRVHSVLMQVGYEGSWPKKPELKSWLCETASPEMGGQRFGADEGCRGRGRA